MIYLVFLFIRNDVSSKHNFNTNDQYSSPQLEILLKISEGKSVREGINDFFQFILLDDASEFNADGLNIFKC